VRRRRCLRRTSVAENWLVRFVLVFGLPCSIPPEAAGKLSQDVRPQGLTVQRVTVSASRQRQVRRCAVRRPCCFHQLAVPDPVRHTRLVQRAGFAVKPVGRSGAWRDAVSGFGSMPAAADLASGVEKRHRPACPCTGISRAIARMRQSAACRGGRVCRLGTDGPPAPQELILKISLSSTHRALVRLAV
jgi:hypothetical protein